MELSILPSCWNATRTLSFGSGGQGGPLHGCVIGTTTTTRYSVQPSSSRILRRSPTIGEVVFRPGRPRNATRRVRGPSCTHALENSSGTATHKNVILTIDLREFSFKKNQIHRFPYT